MIRRNQRDFRAVTLPYHTNPPPNSAYWREKLREYMPAITADPKLLALWDSRYVPENTTLQEHAELAGKIVRGEFTRSLRARLDSLLQACAEIPIGAEDDSLQTMADEVVELTRLLNEVDDE